MWAEYRLRLATARRMVKQKLRNPRLQLIRTTVGAACADLQAGTHPSASRGHARPNARHENVRSGVTRPAGLGRWPPVTPASGMAAE
jgi:hypothetical protein